MKLAEIYINKAKKDTAKKTENIQKAIDVYAKLAEKYPTLKSFAKLQEGNTAFQNEMDDPAIEAEYENGQYIDAEEFEKELIAQYPWLA